MCTCLCIVCYVSASYVHNGGVVVCLYVYIYIHESRSTRGKEGNRYTIWRRLGVWM